MSASSQPDGRSDPPAPRPTNAESGGVSLVFLVHNEGAIIEHTIRNYASELGSRLPDLEIIVAEDGSTDDTKAVLERLALELPLRLLLSDERKGYQRALVDAVAQAAKPWVFIVDSDYQFAPVDFWRLEGHRGESDVILGIKTPRRDPPHRLLLSKGYNILLRAAFDLPYQDMDTGFRLVRRTALTHLAPQVRHMSFFTAEFVIRAHFEGYRIKQVPVRHYARPTGGTRIFHLSSLFRICWDQFVGMLRLRQEISRARERIGPTHAAPSSPPRRDPGGRHATATDPTSNKRRT
jgi:glycosyltransferase involved in cell wall biosynthesis